MARYRMIKPDFWTSDQIVRCTLPTRLLFIGLWNFCDDGGIFPASASKLKANVYPNDHFTIQDVENMTGELLSESLIESYVVDGKEFWHVTGWHHQVIEYPSYRYPRSKEFGEAAKLKRIQLNEPSSNLHLTFTEPSLVKEGKGREGKGRERKGIEINNRSDEGTAEKNFIFSSEEQTTQEKVIAKAKQIAKILWPARIKLKDQDRDEVFKACYLSEVLLSQSWLEEAVESTALKKAKTPGSYFRKCLLSGAEKLGYDYHALLSQVTLPDRKKPPAQINGEASP